jgi:hypothetical protein
MDARRSAGIGLAGYGLLTLVAMFGVGVPGGSYEPDKVSAFLSADHFPAAAAFGYVGVLASFGLLVFARGVRSLAGSSADVVWGLGIAATAAGVVGAVASAGIAVAAAESGSPVRDGVPLPVVQMLGEVTGLVFACVPALFAGVIALVLARRSVLPTWMRVLSGVAGVCGVLAPAFFTLFLFVLWSLVLGGWLAVNGQRLPSADPVPALV